MPVIRALKARVAAWQDLVESAEKAQGALKALLENPHPLSERRRREDLAERLARTQEALSDFRDELTRSQWELQVAEKALGEATRAASERGAVREISPAVAATSDSGEQA